MKVDKETLLHISDTLLLEFSEDELFHLQNDFETFLYQYDMISKIDGIDKETPISFPYDIHLEELPHIQEQNLDKKETLKNAKEVEDDFVTVKKVVG